MPLRRTGTSFSQFQPRRSKVIVPEVDEIRLNRLLVGVHVTGDIRGVEQCELVIARSTAEAPETEKFMRQSAE